MIIYDVAGYRACATSALRDARNGKKILKERITVQQLDKLYTTLSAMTVEQRIREYDLRADRADVIVPATRIFLNIAEGMTLGATFSLRNPYFPTDLRLNYEKYWYPHGGAKESKQNKI